MFKMRHIFGFSHNAQRPFQNAREGVPDAPFSRNCARSGSTDLDRSCYYFYLLLKPLVLFLAAPEIVPNWTNAAKRNATVFSNN